MLWRYLLALITLFFGSYYLLNFSHQLYSLSQTTEETPTRLKISGMLDRFLPTGEGVILLESVGIQIIIPREKLPRGIEPSMYLSVLFMEDDFEVLAIDHSETRRQRELTRKLQEKLRQLSNPN